MPNYGDGSTYPMKSGTMDTISRRMVIDIGATGAPTVFGDPGMGATRNTVGVYDITFPPIADYTKTLPILDAGINKSAATTVAGVAKLAFAPGSGTAQIRLYLATPGTGVEAASGDQIWIEINAGGSGVR